jgi:PTH1 family peptidyl-tRNA hydrolase
LGNPGEEYAQTRHNLGFMVVERVAAEVDARVARKEAQARTSGFVNVWGSDVLLFMPQTFMNLGGASVKLIAAKYEMDPREILIVCDDADLPFGRLRIRASGGAGGHRGLESIIAAIGKDFPRLRLGMSNEYRERRIRDFVLDRFTKEEEKSLDAFLTTAVDAVHAIVTDGLHAAMNRFNRASVQDAAPSDDRPA